MEKFQITEMSGEGFTKTERPLPEEIPLTIEVNGSELATLLASPSYLDDMARGFLFTSGMIADASEIKSLDIDPDRFRVIIEIDQDLRDFVFKRIYTSGCGKGVIFHNPIDVMGKTSIPDGFQIASRRLSLLMKQFLSRQTEYTEAGGIHGAAIASSDNIDVIREDIGRHNAIDKVIGASLAAGLDMSQAVMLSTGRVSSEIFSKVLRARIPVVAAIGAPTNQAVRLARVTNITLVARLRGNRGQIFSGDQRIVYDPSLESGGRKESYGEGETEMATGGSARR